MTLSIFYPVKREAVSMRHNSLRDTMANLMKEAGSSDVQIESPHYSQSIQMTSVLEPIQQIVLDWIYLLVDYSQHLSALSLM